MQKQSKKQNDSLVLHKNSSSQIVIDEKDQNQVFKIIQHEQGHNQNCFHLKKEYEILKLVSHPNIISLASKEFESKFVDVENQVGGHCCIKLEKLKIDLFKSIQKQFPNLHLFSDLKSWFQQIAKALQYLHDDCNIFHLDVKLDNIIIDNKNKAKLCDFGLSSTLTYCQDFKIVSKIWCRRSKYYLPKEANYLSLFVDGKEQKKAQKLMSEIDWQKIDVFSFGICIFNAFFLTPPFQSEKVNKKDAQYGFLYKKQFESFWNSNDQFKIIIDQFQEEQKVKQSEIDSLKDLVHILISYNPEDRPDFKQILKHEFFSDLV